MNMRSLFPRFCYSPIVRLATVMLIALGWSSLAFCGEIHDAAKNGDLGRVKALVKESPDLVFSRDDDGWTALHYAALNGKKDVVELLLANKADVNAKAGNGATPLDIAAGHGHKGVTELLRRHGGQEYFSSELHEAAQNGDLEKVKALLKDNPDLVFSKDSAGATPLHLAAINGRTDGAKLLLADHADVNAKDNQLGYTPLHCAAFFGHKDVAELLLASHADVNAKDNKGSTPLHLAAGRGHRDVVELLLANNADVNAKANNGATPLDFAGGGGHKDVVELLRLHGSHE